ncbi:MAG: peroxiredoxin family protein [Candidatus Obscuribacterales bacterium]|nr:peroxiredoxin family protein [Candidatus Obscuribacterales bacterium]
MTNPKSKTKKIKKKAGFPVAVLQLGAVLIAGLAISRLGLFGPDSGQKAPEISSKIQDGSTVRLSDFKKKVIFLDFWGDW